MCSVLQQAATLITMNFCAGTVSECHACPLLLPAGAAARLNI
jgi:hypothetical protein